MKHIFSSGRSWTINHMNINDDTKISKKNNNTVSCTSSSSSINYTTSDWNKLKLILWKNYLIQIRHPIQTIVEILLPLIFISALVILRHIVTSEKITTPTIYDAFDLNLPPYVVQYSCDEIYYAPKNNITDKLMDLVHQNYFSQGELDYKFTGFSNEKLLLDSYTKKALEVSLQNDTDSIEVPILGGVVFTGNFENGTFSNLIQYTLRFPAKQRTDFDIVRERFGGNAAWFTENTFPDFQLFGPRSTDNPSGGLPGYSAEGFLYLQFAIDTSLIRVLANPNDLTIFDTYEIKLQRFPYPGYINDVYLLTLQFWLALIFMMSFFYPVLNITRSIVNEKEKRLKEYMKVMGTTNYLHWIGWFIKYYIFLAFLALIITIIIKVRFSSRAPPLLEETDPIILFLVLLVFLFQTISYAFFVSTFVTSAKSGATAAAVLWLFSFTLPVFYIQPRYHLMSHGAKIACCLFTNVAMGLACQIFCIYEGTGAGLQWSTFFQPPSPDDNFSIYDCIGVTFGNGLLYLFLTFYIEKVFPGKYGLPLPWNFIFKKWYWTKGIQNNICMDNIQIPEIKQDKNLFESEPQGHAGIKIVNLSKIFNENWVVKNVRLNMYENEITALLGHNGAGKTTTMSMLTGLFPPTNGTVYLNNYDICKNIEMSRSTLGICPQHDILFDELTVEEHLIFFGSMKGIPQDNLMQQINQTLLSIGLIDKKFEQTHTLSGGMKRKLSVGIALCGGSKIVLLDEPTSGMDLSARRSTWELLQKEKKGRTILLSTHFMEEADILGDRIAIMAEGELQCCGSSLFLKKKYGGGYNLIIVKHPDCIVEKITDVLRTRIPDIEITENIGCELKYELSEEKSHLYGNLFHELENRKIELGISSYGTSNSTMEEVFLQVGREVEKKISDEFDKQQQSSSSSSSTITKSLDSLPPSRRRSSKITVDLLQHTNDIDEEQQIICKNDIRNTGIILNFQQLIAMITKKWIYSLQNRILLLVQMGIPSVYLLFLLLLIKTIPGLIDPRPHLFTLSVYETAWKTVTTMNCNENTSIFCQSYKDFVTNQNYIIEKIHNSTFIDHILNRQNEDLVLVNSKYIIGFEERPIVTTTTSSSNNNNYSKIQTELIGFFNNQPFHSPPLSLNFLTNTILQKFTNHTVELTNYPFPYSNLNKLQNNINVYGYGFQVGFNITLAISFLSASFLVFLITEKESKSKLIQIIGGLRISIYWISNFIVDFFFYIISCLLLLCCFLLIEIEEFKQLHMIINLFIILCAYGGAIIPLMYLSSFAFNDVATGFSRMAMLNILSGTVTMMAVTVVGTPEFHLEHISDLLHVIFLIFPNYAVGMGIFQMSTNYHLTQQCQHFHLEFLCLSSPENYCCTKSKTNFFDWEPTGIGKNIFYMGCVGFLSFVLVMCLEIFHIRNYFNCFSNQKQKQNILNHKQSRDNIDCDVLYEEERIKNTNLTKLFETDNLILHNLTKYYGNTPVVNQINLGIKKGETFGLLGTNGAGKTTIFKMLTSDTGISYGDAYINYKKIKQTICTGHNNYGYCPQFDGILNEMSGRQILIMFARLKGIQESQIQTIIQQLANDLIFYKYLDKKISTYSGGNKRKLSTAIALVGNPPIVFLDEPTTGMDPLARRHLWKMISKLRDSGTSIVLTSHSMEECEALCSRLAIMVNGRFNCIGSPQHLKNKFGKGYTIIAQIPTIPMATIPSRTIENHIINDIERTTDEIWLNSLDSKQNQITPKWTNDLFALQQFIENSFPGSTLENIRSNFVHYHIPHSTHVSWGYLFEQMEIAKSKFSLDAYSVGQTSLEQVFLHFTKLSSH